MLSAAQKTVVQTLQQGATAPSQDSLSGPLLTAPWTLFSSQILEQLSMGTLTQLCLWG